jgi:cardiolipin synthase
MIIGLAVIVFHVLGLISSIHAVMSTRTPQGAIAWAVSLNTFPYLAVPAYWVLGRSRFQGYVTARQAGEDTLRPIVEQAAASLAEFRIADSIMADAPAGRAAERLAGLPYLRGNTHRRGRSVTAWTYARPTLAPRFGGEESLPFSAS